MCPLHLVFLLLECEEGAPTLSSYSELQLEPAVANCGVESIASEYEKIIDSMQAKYDALYYHCCNMANDIQRKEDMITALSKSETLAMLSLSEEKEAMVKSLLTMVNKERKVKLISWFHNITHEQVTPTQSVRQKMASSALGPRRKIDVS